MSTIAETLQRAFSRALMPPVCCLCGATDAMAALDLCDVCTTLLPVHLPMSSAAEGALSGVGRTLVRVVVPFHYAYPIDRMIRALKFDGERVHARVLGTLLAHACGARSEKMPDRIVPLPLHTQRYRQRGFNQAHEIARFAATRLGMPVDSQGLARTVATLEQSGLSLRERRRNVRGAFAALRSFHGQRVALVDDVLTTGSTALAAAQALLDAGAEEVALWAVARVERV